MSHKMEEAYELPHVVQCIEGYINNALEGMPTSI